METKNLKTILIQKNISTFVLILISTLLIISYSFKELSILSMEDKATAISEVVKAGLTSHMKNAMMDKRDYFLREIINTYGIKDLKVIRSTKIDELFANKPKFPNEDSKANLSNEKKFEIDIIDNLFAKEVKMKASVPYIASSQGTLNCLICHTNVKEGEVLGVLKIELDMSDYKEKSLQYLLFLLATISLLLMLGLFNSIQVLRKWVIKPLQKLVKSYEYAILNDKTINISEFKTVEFQNTAKDMNILIEDIKEKSEIIELKNKELEDLNKEIDNTLAETVITMGEISEIRCKETGNHVKRVAEYSKVLALKLGLSHEQAELIRKASSLHDVGKIGIPDSILLKPAKLTEDEFAIIKTHSNLGYEMLRHSSRELLKTASTIAYEHHERWDGNGYPNSKKGDEIELVAQIVAITDVFDALASDRVYKKSWELDRIIEYFKEQKGKQFNAKLVDVFFENLNEFLAIRERYKDIFDESDCKI